MNTAETLEAAIENSPNDVTLRHVYLDYLEEKGEGGTEDTLHILALAELLECELDAIEEHYRGNLYSFQGEEYLVCTDEEAEKAVEDKILENLHTFEAEFILDNSKLDLGINMTDRQWKACIKAVETIQRDHEDDVNPLFLALLVDPSKFVENAVQLDGRGHFLSGYDGEERQVMIREQPIYIYRQN